MGRKSKLTVVEIEEAEQTEDNRRQGRKLGFSLMDLRDQGYGRMSNGVVIEWPIPKERRKDGVPYRDIPKGKFILHVGREQVLCDADEFMKFLRWA